VISHWLKPPVRINTLKFCKIECNDKDSCGVPFKTALMTRFASTFAAFLLLNFIFIGSYGQNVQYANGHWFTGSTFERQVWYSINGLLTKTAPPKIDSVVNLDNGYVVPPFGEAHNHNVTGEDPKFTALSNRYLRAGIFYVKNPNSLREGKEVLIEKKLINHPRAIDAVFAVGGLTASGGHPSLFFANSPKGEGNFWHTINSVEEFEGKWGRIVKNNPDFIKTYLVFSEEFELRNGNTQFIGSTGLNPALLPIIVKKAHADGYRVATHVETAHDFHVAVAAGVDELAHIPGFRGDPKLGLKMPPNFEKTFSISRADAEVAAKRGVVVTTTLGDFTTIPKVVELRRKGDLLHKANLATLKNAGVTIVLGSDAYEKNSLIEVAYLRDSGVFTELELLKLLCENTPQSIFPGRKIGKLGEGYEASFLVLSKNPLTSTSAYSKIVHWVKQGVVLDVQMKE
jgi:hypothetical protein